MIFVVGVLILKPFYYSLMMIARKVVQKADVRFAKGQRIGL